MRMLLWFVAALILFWAGSFVQFIAAIPRNPVGDSISTDAIIVLTGGSLRIHYGFELLEKGKATRLLISGVGESGKLKDLLDAHRASDRLRQMIAEGAVEIALDHRADSTHTNARESAAWVAEEKIRSVRLVTANYHLPRSLLEFRMAMPAVIVVPDPVFPDRFQLDGWWRDEVSRSLLLSEFHKYLATWLLEAFN